MNWIKQHRIAIGSFILAISCAGFAWIYAQTYNPKFNTTLRNSQQEVSVTRSENHDQARHSLFILGISAAAAANVTGTLIIVHSVTKRKLYTQKLEQAIKKL
jgi:hypothetical protein